MTDPVYAADRDGPIHIATTIVTTTLTPEPYAGTLVGQM
tara:strand:- start:562 stop:678 length:117 start_codon:yes stop_codon:yes gene_type:complete